MDSQGILNQSVASLKGIGGQTVGRLEKLAIRQIRDLIFHLPLRYEDRTRVQAINELTPGSVALICAKVVSSSILNRGRRTLVCQISDETGYLGLRFFHFTAKQYNSLSSGTLISCFGEIKDGYSGHEMIHPEYKVIQQIDDCITKDTLSAIYPLTEGLRQSSIRKAVEQALTLYNNAPDSLPDLLPAAVLRKFQYPTLIDALNTLHTPAPGISLDTLVNYPNPALKRLAFEEFVAHQLSQLQRKSADKHWQAPVLECSKQQARQFLASLSFKLTNAQQRVIAEITTDCASNSPMLRLIQGDVGSGKTVVSAYAALLALSSQYQVAIMAPTELLAEQHLRNFSVWFKCFDTHIIFLTGQLKGKKRQQALEAIADGSAGIIIGTHALFQDAVVFARLGLIIIDEQHRFGVNQRMALRDKGQHKNNKPHQLIMTATPIPRTLAMLNYADLDISIIDELPPGRIPVVTRAISAQRRSEVIAKINNWIQQGRQSYWVCTLIEESEALQCEAAEKTAAHLVEILPEVRIGLVHGRMKAADKDQVMQAFKKHQLDLLVATTVIEVGVDVPNAGLMIIENPERLGLSQLHQLRGRVGRGSDDSFCLLMYQSPLSKTAGERLNILRETSDGFIIAEKDLELRGPGEMMGTRQTGQMQFKIASLENDIDLLDQVDIAVNLIQQNYPENIQPLVERWLGSTTKYAEV
ncbi:ATP-dependent DNA helicase RecG [Bathymodiolus japonicus methanotrophic gill symbiont]|uniref:ATP-dependent DNA helicase RecG n=1 Tax=Bathymodiolus japonicus methanotrophic gill symbiont TaxID=113269 RepID=UPI001B411B5D|nr:ATP-dependent DNA helicase RecG [Bathymodiolus japonicus methanotrophic gill symbiont]GFO72232.1 ATP-dependent DNA helicase RecG [Bathymodiolus japonicus methanotrophic gill symbiont]